jgi:hypothetical protein
MKYAIAAVAAVLVVASAFAEVRQTRYEVVARTNATSAVQINGTSAGKLYRVRVDVSGAAKTNALVLVDADGSIILSNAYTSGTTYVSFTNNPVPFVGMDIKTFGANTTAVTNTLTITIER